MPFFTVMFLLVLLSEKLGWSNLELLLDQFKDRLNFGVQKDLLDLVRIPFVKGVRARALFQGGLRTIASIVLKKLSICIINICF